MHSGKKIWKAAYGESACIHNMHEHYSALRIPGHDLDTYNAHEAAKCAVDLGRSRVRLHLEFDTTAS